MTVRFGPRWSDRVNGRAAPRRHSQLPSAEWREIVSPANRSHLDQLIAFANEVLAICQHLNVMPTLSGSLAVLSYTRCPDIVVDDIDLACSEQDFPRLQTALTDAGIETRITSWHVLQALQNSLKVEFDSTEHWMSGLTGGYRLLYTGRFVIKVVELDDLRELYARGVRELESSADSGSHAKLQQVRSRYELLVRAQPC
jgi:hypothetical protein